MEAAWQQSRESPVPKAEVGSPQPQTSDSELLAMANLSPKVDKPRVQSGFKAVKADDYSFFKKRVKLNTSEKQVVIYKMSKAEIEERKRKTPSKTPSKASGKASKKR